MIINRSILRKNEGNLMTILIGAFLIIKDGVVWLIDNSIIHVMYQVSLT
jgi:hypothetical protein